MSESRFDPEVLALLDEIASDPRASLLRMPARPLKNWIAGPEEVLSPHASHLTRAERHLVQAYREEAASVLVEACIRELSQSRVADSSTPPSPTLEARARRLVDHAGIDGPDLEPLERVASSKRVSSLVIAGAAMRLAPSDVARNCLGAALTLEGSPASARRVLGPVARDGATARQRAKALANLGMVCSELRDYEGAVEYNRLACRTDGDWAAAPIWALVGAIQLGRERDVVEFLRRVDQRASTRSVQDLAAGMRRDRIKGSWSPTRDSARALSLVQRLGAQSRELCNAFQ